MCLPDILFIVDLVSIILLGSACAYYFVSLERRLDSVVTKILTSEDK